MARPAKYDKPRDARLNRVCILEDVDFWWDEWELKVLTKMWERGEDLEFMRKHFNRKTQHEVFLALIHLAREERIEARKGGLF